MLEALRRNSKNAIIYVLFGVIIAVFIINFGPGSRGCEGAGGSHNYAASVAGVSIPENEFRFAYLAVTGGGQIPPQFARERHLKEFVMDKLIERELLAQAAEQLGFDVPDSEVEKNIEDGKVYILGVPRKWEEFQKDGAFDYDRFHNVLQNRLGVTVAHFVEIQKRELLADQMRQLMLGGVKVASDQVQKDFEQKETQVNLEYVKFSGRRLVDEVQVTPAEIAAYQKGHDAEIKKQYEEHSYNYKKLDKTAHLRLILIPLKPDASDADVAKAKAKIDEAARKVKAGQPFAEVAKQYSEDHSKGRGGDLGWHKKDFTGLGPLFEAKIFAPDAKTPAVLGPEKTPRGFELVQVEGFRQGDLTLDQVAPEIAEMLLRVEKAKAQTKAQAEEAAKKARAGAKLADLYPKKSDADQASDRPEAEETGMFSRRGELVPDVGVSLELVKAAFQAKAGDVIGPLNIAGSEVVARVKERKDPDMKAFADKKGELERQAEREKWVEVMESWAHDRCVEVRDAGRIKVNDDILQYEGQEGPPAKYEACKQSRLF